MHIRAKNELLFLNVLVIVLIVVVLLSPSDVLQIILGLPFVIFVPGYTLMAALFAKKGEIDGIERVALSFGLSIAVVPLIGLILNYAWEIRLEPVLYSVASFIVVTSIIAWLRRRRIPEQERFGIEFQVSLPGWNESTGRWEKALSVVLALAIVGALGTLIYTVANPKVGERFTEFYILGLGGNASGYPEELVVGEEGRVIVGIANHEHEAATYQVKLLIDDVESSNIGPLTLEHDDKWEKEVGFVPSRAGGNQTVQFLLYREGQEDAYRRLQLWLDVVEWRAPLPAAPILVSPDDEATVPGTSVTFEWSAVSDATSYILIVNTADNPFWGTAKFGGDVDLTTQYTDIGYPDDGTTYNWWVWAVSAGGQSPWPDVQTNGGSFVNGTP